MGKAKQPPPFDPTSVRLTENQAEILRRCRLNGRPDLEGEPYPTSTLKSLQGKGLVNERGQATQDGEDYLRHTGAIA